MRNVPGTHLLASGQVRPHMSSAALGSMRRLLASPSARRAALAGYTVGAIYLGYTARNHDDEHKQKSLPSGWRACCDNLEKLTPAQKALPDLLGAIVGSANVKCAVDQKGSRLGSGTAYAVVHPGSIQEAVAALQACVDADAVIIPQGANTGLTGASVPRGHEYGVDRPTVVINMTRMTHIMPIDDGERLVCLAGAGIHSCLQKAAGMGKESHSVLGSIFLNPTTAAGVAFGSGGTQLRKGPVYTERLLYAKVNDDGKVEIVDTLGLKGAGSDELFGKLVDGAISQADVDPSCKLAASQTSYAASVCDCDGKAGKDVSRFNASTMGPNPCRSEGKVLILATVHDTFPKPVKASTMWISVPDFATAQQFKRDVCLQNPKDLPMSCEYMDKDSVRAVDEAGRVLCWMISVVGIGSTLKALWDMKIKFESLPIPYSTVLADKALYLFNGFLPNALPAPVKALTNSHDHHILITMGEFGNGEAARFDERLAKFSKTHSGVVAHVCTAAETSWVNYFRFAAAPAFRTWCVGNGLEGVSVDYALPKGECEAPPLADDVAALRMRYSHFGCNVVHEDICFKAGVKAHDAKMELKHSVEDMGGKLPAEHGHGTEYKAPADTRERWEKMDPLNVFNPGVGGLSVERRYGKQTITGGGFKPGAMMPAVAAPVAARSKA